MIMTIKQAKFATAVTLIEVMVAIVILSVTVLGTSGFRYYAAMDARKADVQITAARLASHLLNGWKGVGGYSAYSIYELLDPDDYDPGDPNDYNPNDTDPVSFGLAPVKVDDHFRPFTCE